MLAVFARGPVEICDHFSQSVYLHSSHPNDDEQGKENAFWIILLLPNLK